MVSHLTDPSGLLACGAHALSLLWTRSPQAPGHTLLSTRKHRRPTPAPPHPLAGGLFSCSI